MTTLKTFTSASALAALVLGSSMAGLMVARVLQALTFSLDDRSLDGLATGAASREAEFGERNDG